MVWARIGRGRERNARQPVGLSVDRAKETCGGNFWKRVIGTYCQADFDPLPVRAAEEEEEEWRRQNDPG